MGSTCGECERNSDEAQAAYEQMMERRVEQFKNMLEEQDTSNFKPKQIREIEYEGHSLKVKPRFRVSMSKVLKLPGVKEVTLNPRRNEGWLLIRYEPDDEGPNIQRFIEEIQVLANRNGPTRAGRMVWRYMNGDEQWEERYEPTTKESLAVKSIVEKLKYDR